MCKCSTALNFARRAWHLTESFSLFNHSILNIETGSAYEMFSMKRQFKSCKYTEKMNKNYISVMPRVSCLKNVEHQKFLLVDSVHKSHIYVTMTITYTKKMLPFFFLSSNLRWLGTLTASVTVCVYSPQMKSCRRQRAKDRMSVWPQVSWRKTSTVGF